MWSRNSLTEFNLCFVWAKLPQKEQTTIHYLIIIYFMCNYVSLAVPLFILFWVELIAINHLPHLFHTSMVCPLVNLMK